MWGGFTSLVLGTGFCRLHCLAPRVEISHFNLTKAVKRKTQVLWVWGEAVMFEYKYISKFVA